MEIDEKKGVFGWYRPAEGLVLTLGAEWHPGRKGPARPSRLELTHLGAEEGAETPIAFTSFRSMAEFLARHGEEMNDGLNDLTTWGGPEATSGQAIAWPAAGGGEVRLRFGPLNPAAAGSLAAPPAQVYDHEAKAEAAPGAGPGVEVAAIVLGKILDERRRVKSALRRARAEAGSSPAWAGAIELLEAESLEWKRVANALYPGAITEAAIKLKEALAAAEPAAPAPEETSEPPGAPATESGPRPAETSEAGAPPECSGWRGRRVRQLERKLMAAFYQRGAAVAERGG